MPDEHPPIPYREYRFCLTPETRDLAFDLLPLLRVDPNVRRLQTTDFLIALREAGGDEPDFSWIGVQYQPECNEPADPWLQRQLAWLDDRTPRRQSLTHRDFERLERNERRNQGRERQRETIPEIIQRSLLTTEGRRRFIDSMVSPLRRNVDYQSIARRTLLIEPFPDRALPIGEPEFVGLMPLRTDVEVLGADASEEQPLGWTMRESVGIGAINSRGLRGLGLLSADIDNGPWLAQEMPPWPGWVTEGIWLVNNQDGFVGRVKTVYPGEIVLRAPKDLCPQGSPEYRKVPRTNLFRVHWEPTIDPITTSTLWDRLG